MHSMPNTSRMGPRCAMVVAGEVKKRCERGERGIRCCGGMKAQKIAL